MITQATRVATAVLPDRPGVYVLYAPGRDEVLYVGKAATQSIRSRWQRQHLYPRAGGSALRRTLGVRLGLVTEKLERPARYYEASVETAITSYLKDCRIHCIPLTDLSEIASTEHGLIAALEPTLNVRR